MPQVVSFMKTRNRINTKTAQQYLQSHSNFQLKQDKLTVKKELSSLFVEIHEKFLPEPLVLTILMESKSTACHLCIERDDTKG